MKKGILFWSYLTDYRSQKTTLFNCFQENSSQIRNIIFLKVQNWQPRHFNRRRGWSLLQKDRHEKRWHRVPESLVNRWIISYIRKCLLWFNPHYWLIAGKQWLCCQFILANRRNLYSVCTEDLDENNLKPQARKALSLFGTNIRGLHVALHNRVHTCRHWFIRM